MNWLLAVLLLFFSETTFSGNEVGNGGTVLIELSSGKPWQFYDHFETRERYHFSVIWPQASHEISMAEAFNERLCPVDKDLCLKLRRWIRSFYPQVVFSDSNLPSVHDTGMIHIPQGHRLAQLIIQKKNNRTGQVRYHVDKSLWRELNVHDKSIAIIHEVLYRKFLEVRPQEPHSVEVRYFVALLISGEITSWSQEDLRAYFRL